MIYTPSFGTQIRGYLGATSTQIVKGNLIVHFSDGTFQDLGPISAYAIAVANGYLGTEEQWTQLQASSSQSARRTEQARGQAENILNAFRSYIDVANNIQTQIANLALDAQSSSDSAYAHSQNARLTAAGIQQALSNIQSSKEKVQILTNLINYYFGGASVEGTRLVQRQLTDNIVAELWEDA